MQRKTLITFFLFLFPFFSHAQDDIEMADVLRSNGKLYVVVTVLSIVLAGILFFLISIDLRLRKMEGKARN
jgi:hypothetical protein